MTNVVTLSREELHAVSVKFRATVETVLNALPRIPDSLEEFPRGCCGRLSSMLGQILNDRLAGQALFVSAELYEDFRETHAWLRCGNIAIDVTGDQFAGRPAVFADEPDSWFEQWEVEESVGGPAPAFYEMGRDTDADKVYRTIRSLMERPDGAP